ncbi:MAG: hypothetical protein Q9173_001649 [Seirophora scorigena]
MVNWDHLQLEERHKRSVCVHDRITIKVPITSRVNMAIRPSLNAFIQVDGKRQVEYPDEDAEIEEDPNLVSRYIECKSGATFEIYVELKRPPPVFFK